jgi:hypothetical protein
MIEGKENRHPARSIGLFALVATLLVGVIAVLYFVLRPKDPIAVTDRAPSSAFSFNFRFPSPRVACI